MARYKLMGRVIEAQEENAEPLTREQQNALPTELVYETDDLSEAAQIQRSGGFFRDRQTFVSVTSVVDCLAPGGGETEPGGGVLLKQPQEPTVTGFKQVGSADAQPMPQKDQD